MFTIKKSTFLFYSIIFLFVSFSLCLHTKISSAEAYKDILETEYSEEVHLLVGELKTIEVNALQRISVADPLVADIDKATAKEAYLVGKGSGTTSLTIWEETGERKILIKVFAGDLESLKGRLGKLLKNFNIDNLDLKINKNEGKIVVAGDYSPEDQVRINSVLSLFEDKTINLLKTSEESSLVQIDVQILELTQSAARELGIDWLQSLQIREEPYESTSTTTSSGVETSKSTVATLAKVFRVVEWSRDALTAKIRLLESENKAKVLSRPKLVCLSGKEAEFVVGGEIPIVTTGTTSAGTTQTNVEYREYGVILKIKPVVTEDGLINTEINTEVSDVSSWMTIGSSSYPILSTNSASTQLSLRDGDTVFLAGLIKNNMSKDNISGIPILMNIPLVGALFRWRDYSKSNTEIVISVTPSIIRQVKKESADQTRKASEETISTVSSTTSAAFIQQPKIPDSLSQYVRLVQAKIAEAVRYPEEARQFGWEGTLKLSLHLISDGNISEVNIKESSGYDLFDDAAIEAAKVQAPYSSFPSGIETTDLWIDIPISYQID